MCVEVASAFHSDAAYGVPLSGTVSSSTITFETFSATRFLEPIRAYNQLVTVERAGGLVLAELPYVGLFAGFRDRDLGGWGG
ncbi:MAG: hypothetical protein R3C28_11305 [Pirellulaceae bacterium]